jgi:hypothetical protein
MAGRVTATFPDPVTETTPAANLRDEAEDRLLSTLLWAADGSRSVKAREGFDRLIAIASLSGACATRRPRYNSTSSREYFNGTSLGITPKI